jgi:hypothetical protein
MTNVGMQCKGRTKEVTLKYKAVQQAVNDAARALTVPHTPLRLDGVIGRKTAYLFRQVLEEFAQQYPSAPLIQDVKTWLKDPRSEKHDTLASLLSSQPGYAVEVLHGIVKTCNGGGVSSTPNGQPSPPTTTSSPDSSPPLVPPSDSSTVPTTETPVKKKFWTRRKKIAAASAAVIALGLLAYFLLRPKDR